MTNFVIHKKALSLQEKQILSLPKYAKILHVGLEYQGICLWYMFEETNETKLEDRQFHILFTGQEFDAKNVNFIGSIIQDIGNPVYTYIVYHIFEAV